MTAFEEIKKNFGFGCMRLPKNGDEVDIAEFSRMVDAFIGAGFNYFDTAAVYHGGKGENALRLGLTSRYPRDAYVLTTKLSGPLFKTEADIRPAFENQLKTLGVDYVDFYLMHAQNAASYERYKACRAYETAFELKREGKVRHVGLSFHDTAEVLERILTENPAVEVVQIQLNYLDYEDPAVQSRKCLEVCRRFGKPVIVMEPVKGGNLVRLPQAAQDVLDTLHGGSNASYAIRFAASCEGVFMTLSGMSDLLQMNDNLSFMRDFKPLGDEERKALARVCAVFRELNTVQCTACRYCVAGCPMSISIPDLFSCYNIKNAFGDWNQNYYYNIHTTGHGKASDCVGCGQCEDACPQHLPIRDLLKDVAAEFEK